MTDTNAETKAQMQAMENRLMGRISRLERSRRRSGWFTGALLVGLVGSIAVSSAMIFDPSLVSSIQSESTVRAQQFVLEDEDGNLRGLWQLAEDGTVRLSIHDAAGQGRLNLAVLADGAPGVSFVDEEDRRRVVLGLLPDQTSTLVFADGGGVARAVLGVSETGSSSLLFADAEGMSRVSLGLDASGVGGFVLPEVEEPEENTDPQPNN
ncbi:MAG: hypothetical protein HKN72_10930 [Gemmatimonadetes bacterium]|nr:hypothetical protein [Gemmatimonadota bacterium]NNF13733.1 hypothetical protein [Gemmatimonadota bacterium]NNL30412.1 hypothetical protein [Gemmatimonadota bacterium]